MMLSISNMRVYKINNEYIDIYGILLFLFRKWDKLLWEKCQLSKFAICK
jgi:hypothetical protein